MKVKLLKLINRRFKYARVQDYWAYYDRETSISEERFYGLISMSFAEYLSKHCTSEGYVRTHRRHRQKQRNRRIRKFIFNEKNY